ncbi:MAG TPA: L-histidine N(alpha)-methyltransferase [Gemmatimonadaceae bacterium]|nr:L-histidine N(alpha)-methyltransferase [Gemmatimonadaceae bacterium]
MTPPIDARATSTAGTRPPVDRRLRDEVLGGLLGAPKTLPPKLFYDARGAELFERITQLEEYYVTRAELEILRSNAGAIAALAGPRCALVEFGSGAGVKVRLLLDALDAPVAYVPIDISCAQLARVASSLATDYPHLSVRPLCADFSAPLRIPRLPGGARRLAFFPGSTIGNFHPAEATAFLRRVRRALGPGGALILGVDRCKEAGALHAAYDDREGVTAAFNLNLLVRLNRELAANFALHHFRHRAFYAAGPRRVEMHLESIADHDVQVAGSRIGFVRGETIWTESSYKYDCTRLNALTSSAGFEVSGIWTDAAQQFWVAFLVAR